MYETIFWRFSCSNQIEKKLIELCSLACKASSLSSNLQFKFFCFWRLYRAFFSAISLNCLWIIYLFIHGGYLQVIVLYRIKISKIFIIILLKTETCLFTLRLDFFQSNNSIARLIRSVFACWWCQTNRL